MRQGCSARCPCCAPIARCASFRSAENSPYARPIRRRKAIFPPTASRPATSWSRPRARARYWYSSSGNASTRAMPTSSFKTIDSLSVSGKRVLVRVDLNVPMKDGKVTDAMRIERSAPTLKELADKGAKVIVLSHFGRPDGKRVPEMSLRPLVEPLAKAIGKPVAFADDCIGPLAEDAVRALKPGEVLLLENLRFHKEEEKNDAAFIDKLSVLGDVYVNDAFSAAHRAHSSTECIAHRLPAAAGRLMQAELEHLDSALGNPKKPVCAVVGGAKVSTKLDLLGNLVGKVDKLIIGGGMANTFLQAQGIAVGKSLSEKDHE